MRYLITLLISLSVILFISGCATKKEVVTVYKTKLVYRYPPSFMYEENLSIPKPFDKSTFIKADPLKRQIILTNYIIDLMKSNSKCILYYNNIKDWIKTNKQNTSK